MAQTAKVPILHAGAVFGGRGGGRGRSRKSKRKGGRR